MHASFLSQRARRSEFFFWLVCLLLAGSSGSTGASPSLYTSSNAATKNEIIRYEARPHRPWTETGRFETGGAGTGHPLPATNSVALSRDRKWLAVVNAGSHEVSLFRLGSSGPKLSSRIDSGGLFPLSLAFRGRHLYVLNSGSDSVASFAVTPTGTLVLEPEGVRPLTAVNGRATTLGVTPDGRHLIVSERAVNRLTAFAIDQGGRLAPAGQSLETEAKSPFALSFLGSTIYSIFAGQGPGNSAVGVYRLTREGRPSALGAPVMTGETAACWSALSGHRRLLYIANAGSHSLTGFRVGAYGRPPLIEGEPIRVETGSDQFPRDLAFTRVDRTLAVLISGTASVNLYKVGRWGALTLQQSLLSVPDGAAGLVSQ